jgi:uncharacterized protein YcnI
VSIGAKQGIGVAAVALAALLAGVAQASAHVTVQPKEAPADSYFQLAFSVPHGCDGSSTVALRVKLPDGILSAKPQMKPGWKVEIKTKKLATPLAGPHGGTISDVVDEVAWRGGPLPDNLYDTFGMILRLPDKAGENLYFPVVQECEKGVHRWIEIPAKGQDAEKLREPAPFIHLNAKGQ